MIILEHVTGLLEKRFIFINQLNIVLKLLSAFILLLCLLLIIILLQSFPIVILVLILQIILKNNLIIKAFKTVVRKNHEIADDIGHNGKEIEQKLYNCLSNNDKNTIIEITNYYKEELHRININDSENL